MDCLRKTQQEAYLHARYEIKDRWHEAEPVIAQDAECAYKYALDVIKGHWPEAEETIQQDARWAYFYALNVIDSRWPEAELTIAQNIVCAFWYAIDVIGGRWPEAEEAIKQSDYESHYISYFFSEPVVTKDQYSELEWEKAGAVGYFAPRRLFERKESLIDMMINNLP